MTTLRAQLRAALIGLPLVLALLLAGCAGKPADSATAAPAFGSSSSASATKSGAEQRIHVTFAHGKARLLSRSPVQISHPHG